MNKSFMNARNWRANRIWASGGRIAGDCRHISVRTVPLQDSPPQPHLADVSLRDRTAWPKPSLLLRLNGLLSHAPRASEQTRETVKAA